MKKIGLLGGTFNPVHKGHLQLAEGAIKLFDLDFVYFIPTGISYHKEVGYLPEAEDRFKMLEMAIEGNSKYKLSDCDMRRSGPTYTIDTIRDMIKIEPGARFYWIMGSDAYLGIKNWKDIETVARYVTFLVALRRGDNKMKMEIFRDTLPLYLAETTVLFEWNIQDISSGKIKNDMINKKYLPRKVFEYIITKGLYQDETR